VRVGGQVDAADAVQPYRALAAEQQSRPQFDPVLGDAVAGGEVPHQADAGHHQEGDEQRAEGDQGLQVEVAAGGHQRGRP
jgi:hypothetical protein